MTRRELEERARALADESAQVSDAQLKAMDREIKRILDGAHQTMVVHFFSAPSVPCPCRWCVKVRETPWDSMT